MAVMQVQSWTSIHRWSETCSRELDSAIYEIDNERDAEPSDPSAISTSQTEPTIDNLIFTASSERETTG